jgi:hypothetical protein
MRARSTCAKGKNVAKYMSIISCTFFFISFKSIAPVDLSCYWLRIHNHIHEYRCRPEGVYNSQLNKASLCMTLYT